MLAPVGEIVAAAAGERDNCCELVMCEHSSLLFMESVEIWLLLFGLLEGPLDNKLGA